MTRVGRFRRWACFTKSCHPLQFFFGFLVGLLAPVAAIAAMVAGVRFLTGKMPFLSLSQDEERRHVSLDLVPQEEVSTRFAPRKKGAR